MTPPSKATSVTEQGEPDGFCPTAGWSPEVIPGGYTRLVVSLPPEQLETVHRALIDSLSMPRRVLYVQLVDRLRGIQLDPPVQFVGLDISTEVLNVALEEHRVLCYQDGRHQLWVQGRGEDKVVMEETGVLYVYPDDPSFRDVLEAQGVPEGKVESMADRDFVRVEYLADADAEEVSLRHCLGLVRYGD
jgi:hypothetical protein